MKSKFWLTRNNDNRGRYNLFFINSKDIPKINAHNCWECNEENSYFLAMLCPELTKKFLGLKKHLPKSNKGICQIELEINSKIINQKSTKLKKARKEG